ncbi:MBL fold metallo-hydrolase [Pullulanibacillus camelliae]|uniref:MBL fold metallo-hydrolase n=1 Tax=Pullulanibacillus camelliae TaxID=1707096 RepID=A0A8J2VJ71_9BACL|nr:MBL fold metallo-hydrolase [Pullulanibacillus camelliae]GGE26720.1 MBL fold metallo-hydrolase [Pullulanibacillus camelliae]
MNVYRKGKALLAEIHETQVPKSALALWNLGQSGLLIKNSAQQLIAIDPYLTDAIEQKNPETEFRRVFPPILAPEDLKGIAGVFITHHHDDHLDTVTIEGLAQVSPETPIFMPAPHVQYAQEHCPSLQHAVAVKADTPFSIGAFSIQVIASAHPDYERDEQGNDSFVGYVFTCDEISVYHSGDTLVTAALYQELQTIQPEIACLPINGGDFFRIGRRIVPNMSFREAADLGVGIKADLIMPVHYDLFPNNRENPSYFVDYLLQRYPGQKFHMSAPGERFIYFK